MTADYPSLIEKKIQLLKKSEKVQTFWFSVQTFLAKWADVLVSNAASRDNAHTNVWENVATFGVGCKNEMCQAPEENHQIWSDHGR